MASPSVLGENELLSLETIGEFRQSSTCRSLDRLVNRLIRGCEVASHSDGCSAALVEGAIHQPPAGTLQLCPQSVAAVQGVVNVWAQNLVEDIGVGNLSWFMVSQLLTRSIKCRENHGEKM